MRALLVMIPVATAATAAGCGTSSSMPARSSRATPTVAATTTGGASPGALQAEANSAATGDIPDNQTFVAYANPAAGYSMKYPEGWAQSGGGRRVVIRDKNNIIRVFATRGPLPGPAAVRRQLAAPARMLRPPQTVSLPGGRALKLVYSTQSAPNAVTGKRVTLLVDRYYVARGGKLAVVDLGTPAGVDNVDAYRLMIQSFRWR